MADCVAEARWLAGEGVKELIIVVAQDPTAYGADWGKPGSICELLDKLNKVPGLEWIRIMYAYPERITDEFIAAMKRNEKVVPYLDLPIQHCNDTILKNMNRRSNRAELLEVIGKLRREIPGITLRTTLIAGFPGENRGAVRGSVQLRQGGSVRSLGLLCLLGGREHRGRQRWTVRSSRRSRTSAPNW